MKKIRYFILGIVITILSFGGLHPTWGQKTTVEFLATYTQEEIYSGLEPNDRFFQLLGTTRTEYRSSSLGDCHIDKATGVWSYIHSEAFLDRMPEDVKFAWGVEQNNHRVTLYALKTPGPGGPLLDQKDIKKVEIEKDRQQDTYSLLITFAEEGREEWAAMTGANIGGDIAIVIDGRLYAVPRVMEQINLGKCRISGDFDKNEISGLQALLDHDRR